MLRLLVEELDAKGDMRLIFRFIFYLGLTYKMFYRLYCQHKHSQMVSLTVGSMG